MSLEKRFPFLRSLLGARLGLTLAFSAALFVLVAYGEVTRLIVGGEGAFTSYGKLVGGDFVVFKAASEIAGAGQAARMYDFDFFSAQLREKHPEAGSLALGWLYPPTMLLLVAPLALLPFLKAYMFWIGSQLTLFGCVLWSIWSDRRVLLFGLGSPVVLHVVITGQTGMLTASLLAVAACFAHSRPLLAGVAAGLLTVKPQFGLLLPIAFLGARCWRTIAVAAVSGLTLGALSLLVVGVEPWFAFPDAVSTHSARMQEKGFAFGKLITPLAATRSLGFNAAVAQFAQMAVSSILATYVWIVWRRVRSADLRAAMLIAATPLATPYAFYYELAIFVVPVALVVREAHRTGWLRGERASVVVLWILSFLPPGVDSTPALPLSFLIASAAFAICARRTATALRLSRPTITPLPSAA